MELEITPEPTPEERAAIEAALAVLLDAEPSTRAAWWRVGLADAVDDGVDVVRARTSPGP